MKGAWAWRHFFNVRPIILFALFCSTTLCGSGQSREPASRKTLNAPTAIQGYACASGYAWFYDDGGGLSSCRVSGETAFGEVRVPAGSMVHLNPRGRPDFVFLSRNWSLRGLPCRGGGHDYMTTFYPSGKLKLCWLAEDRDVGGIPCAQAGFFADVFGGGAGTHFHENGELRTCRLSRAITVRGTSYEKGGHPVLPASGAR